MTLQTHPRSLSEIERDIQVNRKALFRAVGGKFDVFSAAAWGWAWGRHPKMQARDRDLNGEYCEALRRRDERKVASRRATLQRRQRALAQQRLAAIRAAAQYQMAAILMRTPTRRSAKAAQYDPWHIGELPGDDGLVIRDQSGLMVAAGHDRARVARVVAEHNEG